MGWLVQLVGVRWAPGGLGEAGEERGHCGRQLSVLGRVLGYIPELNRSLFAHESISTGTSWFPEQSSLSPPVQKNVVELIPMNILIRELCLFIPFSGESRSKEAEAEVTDLTFCRQRDFVTWVDIRCLKYSWAFDPC